jgi:ubiquitin carboxyl-terminal hydrolase 8
MDFFKDKGKVGIPNIGNTCYMNTTLQCLGHCESFLQYILGGKYKDSSVDQSLIDGLRNIYSQIWIHNTMGDPRTFAKAMTQKVKAIYVFEQNDICEFVVLLIDKVNDEICKKLYVSPFADTKYKMSMFDIQRKKMDRHWFECIRNEYSPFKDMLYGQLISQIICAHCGKVHHNYEMFANVMVSIHETSIEKSLHHHFQEEYVNGDENHTWKCDGCHSAKKSKKTVKLWRNPTILIVTLKRFNERLQKINDNVDVPQQLDLSQYTLGKTNKVYNLRAVGFHSGSYHGGHYFAVCKCSDGTWVIKDDDYVQDLKNDNLNQLGKGYVFFYEALDRS